MTITTEKMIRVGHNHNAILLEVTSENMEAALQITAGSSASNRYSHNIGTIYVMNDQDLPIIIETVNMFDGTPKELDEFIEEEEKAEAHAVQDVLNRAEEIGALLANEATKAA